MKSFRPILALLLAVGLAPLPAAAASTPPPNNITVVSDDNYPPYVFRDAEGTLRGILPDQWNLWEKKTGVKVQLKALDWAEAQRLMHDGQADVIDTIFRTPEREQIYDFTPPYAEIRVPIFQHRDLGGIADYPSLRGFTVGVKAGDAVIEKLAEYGIDSIREYPSYETIIQAAKNDEIKVFSVDEPAAVYYLYKHDAADLFRKSFILYTGEFHRAVHKGRPDLLALVKNGFGKITPREYEAIEQKWLGTPVAWTLVLRRFAALLLLVLAGFLLLAGGNLLLRRQVHLRTEELRQNRARIANILRLAPVGICVFRNRIAIEANDLFCHIFGREPREIVGHSSRILYGSDEDYERYHHVFYDTIARHGFISTELHTRRADGPPLTLLINGAPLDPDHPEGDVIFTVLDITERKKSEEDLQRSNDYFTTLFNSVSDAIFIDDAATGQILDVNQRMVDMYGFASREEAIAVGLAPLCSGVPPYSMTEAAEWIRKAREEGPQFFEWHARHRDGHLFWVEIGIRRFQIGSDDRLIVSVRDITERKAAEEERFNYERGLQETQKLESLGLLAGGIAHDFNNLLTAILGNIDLALLDIPRDSSARADLATAISATRRAADLAQQMLAYSGKGHFIIGPLDVAAEIRSTTRMLHTSIAKNTQLQISLPESLPAIVADASQLRQVIMNLVINASEALENQPGSVRISAGLVDCSAIDPALLHPREPLPPGSYVYLEVTDTGTGIRPEYLDKIFDPFFSTKFTGRGLGLPAVLGIVRGHKGALLVDSTPGKGTTVRVLFPASPTPNAATAAETGATDLRPSRSGLVLLVDDEASLRETSSKLLARLGYQVLCAAGGEQALQLFRPRAHQVLGVILDLSMPKMNGVDTLRHLREIRDDIPVLVSSGYAETEVLHRFGDLHVNGFLQKPYTLEILRDAIDQSFPTP